MISEETIEQVTSSYSNCLTAKASKRLRFLKKLKRPQSDLVYYYEEVIRPVIEYASPVWHFSLTSEQSKTLEAVQRRDCQIIIDGGSTYSSNCSSLKLDSLHTRRQQQTKNVQSDRQQAGTLPTLPVTYEYCKRTVHCMSLIKSPICQQIASHICKDYQIQKLFYLLFFKLFTVSVMFFI